MKESSREGGTCDEDVQQIESVPIIVSSIATLRQTRVYRPRDRREVVGRHGVEGLQRKEEGDLGGRRCDTY